MPLPAVLSNLPLPIIGSPLFIISTPKLVIAQCTAGVVGSMPALNARPAAQVDEWLAEITEALAAWDKAHPDRKAAPYAINQIVHKSNDRLDHDMEMCAKYKVPVIITSLGARVDINDAVHGWGGVVLHDIINNHHAHKAIDKGADGLIAVAAGAGGHAGTKSPFALIQEIRQWFDGPLALSGSIATGDAVLAAQAMGADFAYIGSAFIATEEARAMDGYKQSIVDSNSDDIVYSNLFTGVHGNYLKPSIRNAGLDPDNLPVSDPSKMNFGNVDGGGAKKAWKDIWGCGQGIGAIDKIYSTADYVAKLRQRVQRCAPAPGPAGAGHGLRRPAMAARQVIVNARPFDSAAGVVGPLSQIIVEGQRIVAVTAQPVQVDDAQTIDAGGRVVLPGLVDAHVHVTATSHDLTTLGLQPPSLITAETSVVMRDMLHRGFTTVRDAAGADYGLQEAQARGIFEGPRLFIAGAPISQTGGHADQRPKGVRQRNWFCNCAGLGLVGAIADGVGEVRRAVREQVRTGANQIKIMAGGGVSSPTDPLEGTQFSLEELRAAVEEAEAANLYAMAHAYSPRAISRAVQAGVRSIEHGNLLDVATARLMKQHGAYLVPTLVTYAALAAEGERLGWSAEMLAKLAKVRAAGLESVRIARAEGVPVVFGTDLLGHMHAQQNHELTLRAEAMSPVEVLQSATIVAAQLMRAEGQIGQLVPGAWADLLVVDGDPSTSLAMLTAPDTGIRLLMQAGRTVRSTLPA